MKRSVALLIATATVACNSEHSSTPSPVAEQRTSVSPMVPPVVSVKRCQVRLRDIVPAMLGGTTVVPGSWHLDAHRSISVPSMRPREELTGFRGPAACRMPASRTARPNAFEVALGDSAPPISSANTSPRSRQASPAASRSAF